MVTSDDIKIIATGFGAEAVGIANIERFAESPEGFHPRDIYKDCKSVVVFLISMPCETIMADNPLPYTHAQSVIYSELDKIGLDLCRTLERRGIHAIPVPCDIPYEYWDADNLHGIGILSMRHAARLAGLGVLGKNTLLINNKFGNMVYIGAVLINIEATPDAVVSDFACPAECQICMESCPQRALIGFIVNQKLCRNFSIAKTGRNFDYMSCNECRKNCPNRLGF